MGRDIDLSQPLSDEDREFLLARNQHAVVERNDVAFGKADADPTPPGALGTEPSLASDRTEADVEAMAGGGEADADVAYEDMTHKELDAILGPRGLSTSGTIAEKADRLYDAEDEERARQAAADDE